MFLHVSVILFTGGRGYLGRGPGRRLGDLASGCLGPDPGGGWGGLRGSVQGGVQAQAQGVVSRPKVGGVQAQVGGVFIPVCTEADTPSPADGYCCGWYASYRNTFLFFDVLARCTGRWIFNILVLLSISCDHFPPCL